MAGVAFFLWCFLVFLLLGVRALLHWRRTGSFGYRVPNLAGGWRARVGPVLLASGGLLVGLGPFLLWQGWLKGPFETGLVVEILGCIVALGGTGLTWWAQHQMGDSWRFGSDSSEEVVLVVSGLFARVRNPIYTADCLAFTGIALLAPHCLTWIGLGLTLSAFQWQVRVVEEPLMKRLHGEEWRRWAAKTPRFLPWSHGD